MPLDVRRSEGAIVKNTGQLNPILMGYAVLWGVQFLGAIISAAAANIVYRVPLYQVADVTLSLDYCLIVAVELLLMVLLLMLVSLRQMMNALRVAALMLSYVLLAFAPALALQIFAWITQVNLLQDSRLYAMLLTLIASIVTATWQGVTGTGADPAAHALVLRGVSVVCTLASITAFVMRLPKVSMNQNPQIPV